MPQTPSTRWCPTPEQLMILEQLYRGGIRTPNASQIQQITAHLSLYGKIEGKNVFYWFQNHKARDRQKLRRRLSRQHKIFQQQHQQLACSFLQAETAEASAFCLTNQNPSQFLPQGRDQGCAAMEETAQVMNLLCKLETSDKELESMERHHVSSSTTSLGHGSSWMMMMAMTNTVEDELPYYSPCINRPLKTLELFPTTSSRDLLREENKISSSFT